MVEVPVSWSVDTTLKVGKVQIRAARDVTTELGRALDLASPTSPNVEARRPGLACASIAPGEWLLTGAADEVETALTRVRNAFADDLCLAIDLGAGRFVSTISGPGAAAFLSSFTPLDIDPARFPVGAAARTQFGDIGLYVTRVDDQPSYRLIVDQSFAGYLRHLIEQNLSND